MALVVAELVLWFDWTPWEAATVVVGSALLVVLLGVVSLMLMTKNRSDRADLWNIFVDMVKADLQPFCASSKLERRVITIAA